MSVIATTPQCDEDLAGCNLSAPYAVAVGNEVDGISCEMLALVNLCVRIEMSGMVESLNAAVVAGIVLHAVAVEEHEPDAVKAKKGKKAAKQLAGTVLEEEEHEAAWSKTQRKSRRWADAVPVKIFTQPTKQPETLAVATIPSLAGSERHRILVLEEINSAFNVGMILRCAEAFGIHEVLRVMKNAADWLYVRTSMGAIFRLNISVMESAAAAISHCKRLGVRVIATTPHCDEDLAGLNFSDSCAVAMGNEAEGLSNELLASADLLVRIEMFGTVDSLNVAIAAGIVLHAMAVTGGVGIVKTGSILRTP